MKKPEPLSRSYVEFELTRIMIENGLRDAVHKHMINRYRTNKFFRLTTEELTFTYEWAKTQCSEITSKKA